MRRKKNADRLGYARILDAWIPPPDAGEALGCLATTFTFQAGFFETECLGRMLQLECDPESSGAAYLIEREEKMSRLMSASVVVDQAHARGQRSLRWDLVPFRTKAGILHAKLSLLLWQHRARVIVASANLTESGYRRNLEVFTVFDFHRDGPMPVSLFNAAADFAGQVLAACRSSTGGGSPAIDRAGNFLAVARRRVSGWTGGKESAVGRRSALLSVTPTSDSLLEQLGRLWPTPSKPYALYVLSPFFDPGPVSQAAAAAWQILRSRGPVEITYSVVAEPIREDDKLRVRAPASLATSVPANRPKAAVHFERITDLELRDLHAKSLWVANATHYLQCIGSSNFTSCGIGVGKVRNWELNVAAWARYDERKEWIHRGAAWPEVQDELLDAAAVDWEPASALEDEALEGMSYLPEWCGAAIFAVSDQGEARLTLTFTCPPPATGWSVFDATGAKLVLAAAELAAGTSADRVTVPWPEPRPPTELLVREMGATGDAHWPVEVRSFADLPPPMELRDLNLEQLLEILTSSLPLHRCLARLGRLRDDNSSGTTPEVLLDPLRRFSRETHLLERTRRFSRAMEGMRRRLEAPIPSEEYLQWRLHGPVGVRKVADAIVREALSDGEKAFLLGELALELSRVRIANETGCLDGERVKAAIRDMVASFNAQAEPLLASAEPSLRHYVGDALQEAAR